MLSCQQLTELVTDYLEGRMSLGKRLSFRLHLMMCSRCRAYLRQMKETIRVLGHLPEATMPADVEEQMRRLFRNWASK
jgi:predicted anti-sigma-YlaC factor YlaD